MDLISLCGDRDALLVFAKQRLSDEQQKVFVEHFLMCMSAANGDPFPITGERAMEWLGYGMKHKFKELVEKHLDENVDYVFFTQPSEKDCRGRPRIDLRLTVDGYKQLEMVARTAKGRIVRSYYIQLEKVAIAFA